MNDSVAVVGYACRYPGAPDATQLWDALVSSRETLTRFTDDELTQRGVPVSLRRNPSYVPVGGLIEDQDRFDPAPFGMTPSEAETLDPQQRVFLETAWHALDHAGHAGGQAADVVGVYAGSALSAYLATNLAHRFDPLGGADPAGSLHLHTGNVADYLPLRTAHRLGLTGPAVAVGATCATSLVAVHTAVQALLSGECDTALAGGVSLRVPQGLGYLHVPDGPFSADGHTRPYSADARGTVFTQGAGVVVLRRLSDALASGDHVHAVIMGSAVGNDGADRAGFTAPSPLGQARTIAEALAVADIDPRQVSYVEGHGTGTVLGDPIEVRALKRVFGPADEPWCGLGSVKGNIGHADSAAGIAGLIKTVRALEHRTLPATPHLDRPNPELGLEGSAFRLIDELQEWDSNGPRTAGVSSFGIGGTNCHVIVQEAPPRPVANADARAQLVLVSAVTAAACRATAARLADDLDTVPLADAAHTLAVGRTELPVRAAAAVGPGESAARAVRLAPVGGPVRERPRVVFAFPGGGAQFAGMGADLYRDEPVFAATVDELSALFTPLVGADVRDVVLNRDSTVATDPLVGLPALFTCSVATSRVLESWGIKPDRVLGHSVGEYAAAVAAGVLSTVDAVALVAERSLRMAELTTGAMLAVRMGEHDALALLAEHPELDLAAVNADDACALSGPRDAILRLRDTLGAGRVVGVDVAAHSRLVEPAMPALRAVASGLSPKPAEIPLVTTLTGELATDAELVDPEHWVRHLRGVVRFADALDTALADGPAVLAQVGPGGMLASLAARRTTAVTTFPRADEELDGRTALLDAVGRLWTAGVDLDHTSMHQPGRRRIALPGYAFQRERFWIEPQGRRAAEPDGLLHLPMWRQLPPLAAGELTGRRWAVAGDGPWAQALREALPEIVAPEDNPDVLLVAELGDATEPLDRVRDALLGFGRLGTPGAIVQVSVGGEDVLGGEDVDPVAAAVRGLPRVFAQEVPDVRWCSVDVPSGEPTPELMAAVLAEASASTLEVALRGGRRWRRHWETWQLSGSGLRADAVVVVLGGNGNIGRLLADRCTGTVVLASRSNGVDVTSADDVQRLLERVVSEHGRIDLVVHAAVRIEPSALAEMDENSTRITLDAKVSGALALRTAIDRLPDNVQPTVVLMSSVAGVIGGYGLGAYVAANRFLDGLAHSGRRWVSVVWDRWRLGTEQENTAAAEISMRHALDPDQAVEALLQFATCPRLPAQVAVSPAELNSRSVELGRRTVKTAGQANDLVDRHEQVVAAIMGEALGREITSRDDDFFALGGHSLLATSVLARLRDEHGVRLRLRDLLTRPTVAGLAELVAQAGGTAPVERPARTKVDSTEPFPLTRVQHAYWVGRSAGYALGEVACHFFLEHECRDFDPVAYERAWNQVIARHEMLRSVITPDGHNLVLPNVPTYRLPIHEAEELDDLRVKLSRRVAEPGRWPLIEAHAVRMPDGSYWVLLSVDVLVCDSASYMILDRDLRAFYQDADARLPEIGTTFAECVHAIERRRGGAEHKRAAAYWRGRDLPPAPALAVRESGEHPRFGRRRAIVPAQAWTRLKELAARSGVTPTAVLLTAYGESLAKWSGSDHFSLTLTVFDRPGVHPDVNKLVGEFTSMLLFEVDHREPAAFGERAVVAQARLFDDLDNTEFSGLEVLAEQARTTGRQQNVPVVFTSMLALDQLGGEPHDHEWLGPIVRGISQTPQVWLDHQVYEHHGALVLQWDVAETSLDAEQADHAFAHYTDLITRLAADESLWSAAQTGGVRQAIAEIWADLLEIDATGIGEDSSFVSQGGDSLLAVRMASMIRQRLDVVLALPEIRAEATLGELAELVMARGSGQTPSRVLDVKLGRRGDRTGSFPLLPLQQAYFVGQQGGWELSYSSAHVRTDVGLSDVDYDRALPALTDALDRLVAHQPMLRARISSDGTQRILAETSVVPEPLDLRAASAEEIAAKLGEIRAEMGLHGPDPTSGPALHVRLTLLPDRRARLHTSFSLLVVDGWSAALLERELLSYLADANAVLPPLLVDFGDYVEAIGRIRAGAQWQADRDWWWGRLDALPTAPELPMLSEPDQVSSDLMGARERRLPATDWAALRALCAERDLTPTAVLLTVYAVALAKLSHRHRFLLNSLQSNRLPLHPDVDRMVGAFSATSLLAIDLADGASFTELATSVRTEITQSLAHNLVTGVEVARELGRRRGTHRPVAPVVFQSTLGMNTMIGGARSNQAGPLGTVAFGDYHQRIRTPQVHLELRVFELDDELIVNVAVAEELFGAQTVDALFADVVAMTERLARGDFWDSTVELGAQLAVAAPELARVVVAGGPPRGHTESIIAAEWADLLDLSTVDRSDDFFTLGGDSLLAVRMLGRVGKRLGRPVLPASLLAAPTVAGLAAAIGEQRDDVDDIAVRLRDGEGAPLFLLHPSGGDVLCYAELSRSLEIANPVIALTDPELAGGNGPSDIPAMVRRYLDVIRAIQPEGPYRLGGWSMGGTVGHEVACALRAMGEWVDLLVMIDSNSPERIVAIEGLDADRTEEETRLRFLRSLEAFLGLDLGRVDSSDELLSLLRDKGIPLTDESAGIRRLVFARHLDALAEHHASHLDETVPVLLTRAAVAAPRNSGVGMGVDDCFDEHELGWRPYVAGELTVVEVAAHHYSMLDDPAVGRIAGLISDAMNRGK
jgi:acyl transferase domain-containing protein/non-ribosomal peptide synthetase component F/thioesterase domain-containing protein/aryl carrier-like protein